MSNAHDLEAVRARLMARRADLDALDRATAEDHRPIELDQTAVGRLSRVDSLQMQAMSAASQRMRAAERRRIAETLKRVDSGEYGWCAKCSEEIAPARLDIDPTLATCVRCAV